MRPNTYLICFLVFSLAGATTVAWRQWRELVALRAAALAGGERAALEARLREFRQRNHELQAQLAARHSEKNAPDTDTDAKRKASADAKAGEAALLNKLAALGNDSDGSKRDDALELLAAMADLPEFQKMMALQQRAKVDTKYAALFKKLKLTPEELARLQTLLGDRQGAFADAMLAARDQGLTGRDGRELAGKVARETEKEITGSIKDLLGPQRFNQLQNYERTAPQRETVDQLAQRLSYTTTPLTPRQADQLVQVLATSGTPKVTQGNRKKPSVTVPQPAAPIASLPGSISGLGFGSTNTVAISNPAVAAAQTFLSPQQLAALQRLQQEQQAQQTLGNLLRTGTVNAPPKVPNPPNRPKPGT